MRQIIEKDLMFREIGHPAISVRKAMPYFNSKAVLLLGLKEGVIFSKDKDGSISIAVDSELEPSKNAYKVRRSQSSTVLYRKPKDLTDGFYTIIEAPYFDGQYDWFELEKIKQ